VGTPEGAVEIVTDSADGPGRRVEIDGKTVPQTRLGRAIRMVWLTPAMDRLWQEGPGDRRRFLDRIALGFHPDHADAAIGYEKAMRARNRLLKEGGADPVWISALEGQMARLGAAIARGRADALLRLDSAQRGAQTVFPVADLAIEGLLERRFAALDAVVGDWDEAENAAAADLATALSEGRTRDAAAGRALDGPHRSDLEAVYSTKAMPARVCSTGEQKALLISLCLANARALASVTGAVPILLLDEVAAHLDADRRNALFAEIAALGAQAWMTGTGRELFDGLDPAALRIAVREGPEGTILEPD
jgi:DNA replication and repair protein RecF